MHTHTIQYRQSAKEEPKDLYNDIAYSSSNNTKLYRWLQTGNCNNAELLSLRIWNC